jgi:hypothetical protein
MSITVSRSPLPRQVYLRTGLAAATLGLLVVLASGCSGAKSSVEVSVNWKTPTGVEFDDNPVVVLIPKGMKEKIDVIAPVYAGEDYAKVEGPLFRKCGAYLAVGTGGKAWFENVPRGSYTLIIFPNSSFREIDEGIGEDEARRAEQQLQPFFTRVRLDFLRKKPILVQDIEVKDRVVDVRHEFPRRGGDKQAKVEPKAQPDPRAQPEPKAKDDVAVDPAERIAEEEVRKADPIKVNPSDLAGSNANLKFGGKVVEITAVVKGVRKGRFDSKSGERLIIELEFDRKPEFDRGPVACSFSLRHADSLAKVRPGQTVTIRGRCDTSLPDYLWHCSIGAIK